MFNTTKYKLSLTTDYCEDWTVVNAIRELLQNALDSPETFEYSFKEYSLEITSLNTVIAPKTLLLGCTSKRGEEGSVGGYGEGYKIAALVLLREGYGLTIYNGNRIWEALIEYDEVYQTDVLVFEEEIEYPSDNKNLTFLVTGLESHLEDEIRESCLYLQNEPDETIETRRGSIILKGDDKVSSLYVGGLFVCEIPDFTYSYDMKPDCIELNRDRKTVGSFDLSWETSWMCVNALSGETVAKLLQGRSIDVHYANQYSVDKDACFKLYNETNSGKIAVKTEEEKQVKVDEGYRQEDVRVLGVNSFTEVLIKSKEYLDSLSEIECNTPEARESIPDLLFDFEETYGPFTGQMKEQYDNIVSRVEEEVYE